MAYERIWPAVSRPFLTNGTARGTFTVDDYTGFYVNQLLNLTSTTQPLLQVKIKRIDEDGTIHVGRPDKGIEDRADVSAYLVADNAIATAPEQRIPTMKPEDIVQAVYERDPVKAVRTITVDSEGKPWSLENPVPVQLSDGSISIGTVNAELEVQLSHKDNYPNPGDVHDSVRIGDGTDLLAINHNGSINVITLNRLIPKEYDRITVVSKNTDGDPTLIEFRLSGTLVASLSLTYDSDGDLQDVLRF